MKKTLGYILLFALLTASLTACSSNMNTDHAVRDDVTRAEERVEEGVDRTKEKLREGMEQMTTPMPDLNDGIVNDDDGIITEGDNGPLEAHTSSTKENTRP